MTPIVLTYGGKRIVDADGKAIFRYGTTTIGGKTYKTVQIGTQEWIAENLQLDDGGAGIYTGQSSPYASEKFYNWSAAVRVSATVGDGWHLPSTDEFRTLIFQVGTGPTSGQYLKSRDGWDSYEGISNDDTYGFNAVPVGYRDANGNFVNKGKYSVLWTSEEYDDPEYPDEAYYLYMQYDRDVAGLTENSNTMAVSIRLVRNAPGRTTIFGKKYKTVTIGTQEWLAENLKYDDGSSSIHTYYGEKYYEHYNGNNSYTLQLDSMLTNGWHLPSNDEYATLFTYVGGTDIAGQMLKSETGWDHSGNGLDRYGFNAKPYDEEYSYLDPMSHRADHHNPLRGLYASFATSSVTNNRNNSASMSYSTNSAATYETSSRTISDYMNVRLVREALGYTMIGGIKYKTVKIGDYEWLAENLRLNDGGTGIYTTQSGEVYYTWTAAFRVCQSAGLYHQQGWFLPQHNQINYLVNRVGGYAVAGKALKSVDGWYNDGNGLDSYGFNAMPMGYVSSSGTMYNNGKKAYFWADQKDAELSNGLSFSYDTDSSNTWAEDPNSNRMSVRLARLRA